MSDMPNTTIAHLAICTADLEQSLRFYTEALGFEFLRTIEELSAPFDVLMEIPDIKLKVHQVQCGGVRLELLGIIEPGTEGDAAPGPMNKLGMTHLTLVVDDVEAAAKRIEAYGGTVRRHTQVDTSFGPLLFCTDPNGVRLELMQPMP